MNLKTAFYLGLIFSTAPICYSATLHASEIPTDISQKMKPATLKVLLHENKKKIIVEAKGPYQVCNPLNNFMLFKGSFSKSAVLTHEATGLKWGDLIPGTFHIRIVPTDSDTTILVNGIQYRGCVEVYDDQGSITVVNEVDVESYLRSTLTTQFKHETNREVLNAVAIVARTNIYHMLNKHQEFQLYHVRANDVGYIGYGATLQNPHLESAISSTRHAVMTMDNKPFAAMWNENSAGKTADFSSIFRINTPSPEGVSIPIAESDRQKQGWSFTVSKAQLGKIAALSKISNLSLFSERKSGKVYAVRIADEDKIQNIDFFTLQKHLGEHKLKSNDFTVEIKGESVTFKGYGQGHGTGLCLYSAALLAKHGQDARKILATFFPETKIQKIRSLETSIESGSLEAIR
jgi:SpoIID/LytB domain protein